MVKVLACHESDTASPAVGSRQTENGEKCPLREAVYHSLFKILQKQKTMFYSCSITKLCNSLDVTKRMQYKKVSDSV